MMGNHNGKEAYGTTGSPLDFYHTPPTSRSEAELIAMALPSAAPTDKVQTSSPVVSTTPSSPSPAADWKRQLSTPSEWAMISVESVNSLNTNSSDAAAGREKVVNSSDIPIPLPLPQGSPSEQSWQERDSGMEPQAAAERAGGEMTLVLLSLMEHYRASLGLTPNTDITTGAVEMLRRLITEKDDLVEELDVLKETLRTERLEWQQFQWDLQTAVSVADRLRLESDHALGLLQENHRALEEQLAQTLSRQQETERALESLRVEHKDVRCKLNEVIVQWQQEKAEHDVLRNVCRLKDEITNKQANEEAGNKLQKEAETEITDGGNYDHEKTNGLLENVELTGKGVAEGYIRSLAALEKKKEEGRGQRDPRTIVMLSERSWSLSGLPLQSDSSSQDGTSKNIRTTLPLCKKEEPTKGRRMDRTLQRQDSWSNFYTGKQEEDQTSDSVKPQDGFSALLRRHGGSRRNSLLRWCQSRTQGYKNIEITNFSTCWEDGLAFCAVYHTYLPTHISYDSLSPADKEGNLGLAFKTGESVGIPATLTVVEMLKANGPDWQRVLAYVESIFRHFEM
ncbi:cytospin-A-like isoform X1 [Girardinichthys multiradiatus]|uniref:cytospin-A-like isoform X1 n=1 Tax=Girardinichthys multiradiatus TaxID=208333 RepID=UPI001FACDD23|nr:cytospin-A-like isoform X1 [Girardinichthys multiradiatus]